MEVIRESNTRVLLIHGVGTGDPGVFVRDARPVLRKLGIADPYVHEFNWHAVAGYPIEGRNPRALRLSPGFLAGTMAGIRGAVGMQPVVRIVSGLVDSLIFLVLLAPTLVLGSVEAGNSVITARMTTTVLATSASVLLSTLVLGLILLVSGVNHRWARQIVLIALRPILFVMSAPFVVTPGKTLGTLGAVILGITVITNVGGWLSGEWGFSILVRSVGSTLLAVAIVIGGTLAVVGYVVGPVLKIIADVMRYSGDAQYRSMLHEHLANCVAGMGDLRGRRVIVVGHSLGSIVAIDALLADHNVFADVSDVVLVTMGSPLRRLFARFFPEWCGSPSEIAQSLLSSGKISRWINVYRPFDPIGTRLTLKTGSQVASITDLSTKQWSRVLIWAHVGYWKDDKVGALVATAIAAPPPRVTPSPNSTQCRTLFSGQPSLPPPPGTKDGLLLFGLGVPLAFVWVFVGFYGKDARKLTENVDYLRAHMPAPDTVLGFIEHHKAADRWGLRFQPRGAAKPWFVIPDPERADLKAIASAIGAGGDVWVIYQRTNPSFWMLRDYPPNPDSVDRSFFIALALSLFFAIVAMITLYPAATVWGWYWGIEDINEANPPKLAPESVSSSSPRSSG